MSKVLAYYHIVFCTHRRERTIPLESRRLLYGFIYQRSLDLKCNIIRIGGVDNHIHILMTLHPSVSLSSYMRTIKGLSSKLMKGNPQFPYFCGWADEYFACTVGHNNIAAIKSYIMNQDMHHRGVSFSSELVNICTNGGLRYDSRDMDGEAKEER